MATYNNSKSISKKTRKMDKIKTYKLMRFKNGICIIQINFLRLNKTKKNKKKVVFNLIDYYFFIMAFVGFLIKLSKSSF